MSETSCRLCGSVTKKSFKKLFLNKYDVQFYSCPSCGYFQTESPHWLDEAYTNVINDEDTGIFRRNFFLSNFLLAWLGGVEKKSFKALDYSGGYGILVRMLRDFGFNFNWTDKYCQNIFAKNATADLNARYSLITSFEVIEHVTHPLTFIEELKAFEAEDILLSTQVFSGDTPSENWFYLGPNHGQHIGFFNKKSLQALAEKTGLKLITFRNLHLLSRKRRSRPFFIFCYLSGYFGLPQVLNILKRTRPLE